MAEPANDDAPRSLTDLLSAAIDAGTLSRAGALLNTLHPAEIGRLLESLPQDQRKLVWGLVAEEQHGEVLLHVNDEVRDSLLRYMDQQALLRAAESMELDDLADFLQDLPAALTDAVLRSMDLQHRQRLEAVLAYPEDCAGGLMNPDVITVPADVSLDVVQRYLRLRGSLPELTDRLIVVDRRDRYQGTLSLATLLTHAPELPVADVLDQGQAAIPADMPAAEVAKRFADHDWVSAPVVDEHGRVLGRITVDDVLDVIRDEAEHSIMGAVGLDEEADMFAPVLRSTRRRAIWLGVNLGTAFLASWVIGLFEDTLQRFVALAVLMPIVASMGGIAGSQTLTLVIRGLALGQVGGGNVRSLLVKEISIGLLNGLIWAVVVGLVAFAWFRDVELGLVIGSAMVLNLFCAALTGVTIPLVLRRFGVDPALAGGMVLTTFTDVVGFLAFLGLATLFLL